MSASAHASTSIPASPFPAATHCAALLVLVWLVAMAQLLWHFEAQRLAESQQLMHFETRDLPTPPFAAPQGIAKAIYFIDSQCRCSAAALAEIRRLQRSSTLPLAQFIAAPSAIDGIDAQPLTSAQRIRWRNVVPATPTAALWDARDQLIYFGPINTADFCAGGSAYSKSYLQIALQSIQQSFQQQPKQQTSNQPKQQARDTAFKTWDVVACACPAQAQS